ncbi:MAG: hypothetical protein HY044_05060 [Candidatus Woesebacteria bacterium]|nr:MAG: hypothetical protein HY044_05060 [Candidatus Woesebacteria bacterium]
MPIDIWKDDWRNLGDNVHGATVKIDDDNTHTTVHGDDWHRSWDTNRTTNEISHDHVTTHDDHEHYDVDKL